MSQRARCYDCRRPVAHCLCPLIEPIDHRTEFLILQHPSERGHAFNTARLAELSLRRSSVVVGHGFELGADTALAERLSGYGLLYPRPGARDLAQLPPEERPDKLVVLDGTWHHARAMYRDIVALQSLPHYTLPEGQVSGFRIRKQPKAYCLSTIEAIQSALVCLEPETAGIGRLLGPFDAMQARHMASISSPTPRRKRPRRGPGARHLPPELGAAFESLVVVYGEIGPIVKGGGPRRLLTLAAERPATGERLERVIASPTQPDDPWAFLRLSDEETAGGVSVEALRAAWAAFRRPADVMAAWSRSTLEAIQAHLGDQGPTLLLKAAYCNRRPERGCLEQIVVKEGLISAEQLERNQRDMSRTQERLLSAAMVAKLLHQTESGTES